jgi:hypothetical protein
MATKNTNKHTSTTSTKPNSTFVTDFNQFTNQPIYGGTGTQISDETNLIITIYSISLYISNFHSIDSEKKYDVERKCIVHPTML